MDLAPLPPAFLPGPDFVDRAWGASERSPAWLRSLQALFDAGRLAGTGHLCLLTGWGEPEALAALAQEGGCSGLVAGERALGAVARRYAHRVPLIAWVRAERDPAVQARRIRDIGAVGVCVTFDDESFRHEHTTAALTSAATAEGLVVVAHAAAHPGAHGGALGAEHAAALGWREDWPAATEVTPDQLARGQRELVRQAWGGRLGLLLGLAPRHGDPRDACIAAKRAGAMGAVVHTSPGDPDADVAALHALQDVWADGSITLA